MKAGIYARVSTEKQEESLEEQVRILEDFCKRNKHEIYKVYSETGSGAKSKREKFMELMRDVESRKLDAVVVLKLDRFSRSMLDLLTSVERLKENGVDFISVNDHIETTTPQGKLIFHIMGALAEFERSLIYERTKVGIERAKREGKVCHRPRKNINLDRVLDRYKKGIPLTEIAAIEHVSYSTLRNRLREAGIKLEMQLKEE
ncbi:MAG TPA: recombinase family protein [Methanophagales archaeon]|nr:recombinase family protein [Methanophagales archaeon]